MALYLLGKRPALAEKADDADNLPLHLASISGNRRIVEELLKLRPDMALRKNEDGMAAIHYAARMGYEEIVSCLIDYVPDCTELLGTDNKNALHFALEYGNIRVAKTLLLQSMDPSFLINHPDMDGQTAFHKAAASSELASEMLFQMLEISRWKVNAADKYGLAMFDVLEEKIMATNKEFYRRQLRKCGAHRKAWVNLLVEGSRPALLEGSSKMDSEMKFEGEDNLPIIATLIFMVSFTAAMTVPGGVRNDNGVPVRMHATALQCFTVSNALAFCFSILAMFMLSFQDRDRQRFAIGIHSFILLRVEYYKGFLTVNLGNLRCFVFHGLALVSIAINATVVTFITGVYVTVAPKCLWLALTVCAMAVFTFFISFLMLYTLIQKLNYEMISHWRL